jgi:uncharacterized membrane protein YoaK (UPF0700 family)
MTDSPPRDYLPILLLVLTATTGLVDAVSVLGLGRIFAANMTGNVVFLGFAIGGAPGFSIARCFAAVVAFLIGAALGGYIGKVYSAVSRSRWLLIIAVIESFLLFLAAIAAVDFDLQTLSPANHLYAMIFATGVAMGLRNATVRQLAVPDLTTTVLTLTLTGLAADSFFAGGTNPRWGRRLAAVASMFIGATAGAILVIYYGLAIPLALTGVIVLAATIAYATHLKSDAAVQDVKG